MSKERSTEVKIREAAKNVFIAKGFDGCTSREIAKEAGMNVALVNYYFCSKKQLFTLVFEAAMEDFMFSTVEVFKTDLSLEAKLRIFIEREYEFLTLHPDIPRFILSELSRGDKCEFDHAKILEKIGSTGVFEELLEAQEKGIIRKMDLTNIMLLIMSNCHYPFMAKPLMKYLNSLTDDESQERLMLQKQYVTEMIIGYLFIPNTNK
ncbi:TetR/AcrR family transcriptional regulator [Fluviicola taffensis]|uniref:Regulatory protein TetR n=1 Tax=Fluviicola taffensis (strain DSM 16823 / NCIMB 13979 / RW262) TaxID=755732 RepID=F2IB51_FLUTR|nr:TetR/AcrR family transcriptional regulator [Fluviicola taffensis]AEA42134.1 regulatory protein TetR [Fluviicola taffensis DSM 16823]